MRILLAALMVISLSGFCQTGENYLNSSISDRTFPPAFSWKKNVRTALSIKDKTIITKLNPLFYLGAAGLYFYQNVISEQFQASCTYQVSCSEYTKRAISSLGFVRGVLTGIDQLNNCSSGALLDYPAWKINSELKIDNSQDLELP